MLHSRLHISRCRKTVGLSSRSGQRQGGQQKEGQREKVGRSKGQRDGSETDTADEQSGGGSVLSSALGEELGQGCDEAAATKGAAARVDGLAGDDWSAVVCIGE